MDETNGTGNQKPRLSDKAERRMQTLIKMYPKQKSTIMPALYIAQDELGWLSDAAFEWVADRVGVTPAHARSVATFYTMYYKRPVGMYHVQICRTLSCMLCGAKDLTAYLKKRFGTAAHEVTADGMWSFEEVECLGSCGTAPMVEINDVFFENLTVESLAKLLDRIEREKPDLRFSTVLDDLGNGMPDLARSEVWKSLGAVKSPGSS